MKLLIWVATRYGNFMANLSWICWYPWRATRRTLVILTQSSVILVAQEMPAWALEHDRRITVLETWGTISGLGIPLLLLGLVAVLGFIVRNGNREQVATTENGKRIAIMNGTVEQIKQTLDRVTTVKVRDSDPPHMP